MRATLTHTFSFFKLIRHRYATHAARCVAALITAILFSVSGAARADLAAERQVLIDLYNRTGGATTWNAAVRASWRNAGDTDFKDVASVCALPWGGIRCNAGNTSIESITLQNVGMTGTVPASLAGLGLLKRFDVNDNDLTGSLDVYANLLSLDYLDVTNNAYSGVIPPMLFTNNSQLRVALLSNNQLSGSIPNLSGLVNIEYLFLNNNQLTGTIPPLTGMKKLLVLDVASNQLTGVLPQLPEQDPSLLRLIVNDNRLSGTLPTPPETLVAGGSTLCPNRFDDSINVFWNSAVTGNEAATWYTGCTPLPEQTLRFDVIPALILGGSGTVVASATPVPNSTAPVQYSTSSPSNCTVGASTGFITVLPAATTLSACTVLANKAGDANFKPAPQALSQIFIAAPSTIPASERQVLIDLYNSTGGPGWRSREGWLSPAGTECAWYGVTCDAARTHVTELNLERDRLSGVLPSNLNQLTEVTSITVSNNPALGGSLPALTGLAKLQFFYARNNQHTGSIPLLAGLVALKQLNVGGNRLTGSIPPLTGLAALDYFAAHSNQLTGFIPSLAGLTSLTDLDLYTNQLTGPIPPLTGLTALTDLSVSDNQLSGTIPSLDGLAALKLLSLSTNRLTGPIPSWAGSTRLERIDLRNNQLTGSLPDVSALTLLQEIDVDGNQLSGNVSAPPPLLRGDRSELCTNQFNKIDNAAWDNATQPAGSGTRWHALCVTPREQLVASFVGQTPVLIPGGTGQLSLVTTPGLQGQRPPVFGSLTPEVCTVGATDGVITVAANAAANALCTVTGDREGDGVATNSATQIKQSIAIQAATPNSTTATAVPTLNPWALLVMALMTAIVGVGATASGALSGKRRDWR
jgi:Leucine-rich repeat (LRR) protein